MRFLILSQYFVPEPGAAQLRLAALAKQLTGMGHSVEVVTATPNYPQGRIFPEYRGILYRRELLGNIPVHRVPIYPSQCTGSRRLLNYFSFMLTCLAGLFMAKRPDYIFVESPPLFIAAPAVLYAKLRRTQMIFNVADLWPDSVVEMGILKDGWPIGVARIFESWIYSKSDFVCAVTHGIAQSLIHDKRVEPNRVLLLPNGVDTDLFRYLPPDIELKQKLGLTGKRVVIYAGTHGVAHGLENVLRAAYLLRNDPTLRFLLIGSGSAKAKLIALARALALSNVTFLDAVAPEEVARYFSISFCGLVSIKPIKILSSAVSAKTLAGMACGRAVLFCGPKDAARLIVEADAGLTVPSDNPQLLADAVQLLASEPALAAKYGKNGRAFVEQHFTWPALVKGWLEQIDSRDDIHSYGRDYLAA